MQGNESITTTPEQAMVFFQDTLPDGSKGPLMVTVPPGTFSMGNGYNMVTRNVTITKSFSISIYQVTQGEWQKIMGNNPAHFSDLGKDHPIETVSWEDAHQYVAKLNQLVGGGYRLPTEAEWEYAAKAGKETRYGWGNETGENNANCYDCGSPWDNESTSPVGSFPPNAFGLHDMTGNVWEWVEDVYHDDAYSILGNVDPIYIGEGFHRVIRGGSWYDSAPYSEVTRRKCNDPRHGYYDIGFRLAKTL